MAKTADPINQRVLELNGGILLENSESSDRDTERQIVTHLIKKYKPLAIYLSGSRANCRNRPDSDWDFHLVVDDSFRPVSEVFNSLSIDIKYLVKSKIKNSIVDTPYSPAVPFKCLYRHKRSEVALLDLERRTEEEYRKGPKKWTKSHKKENQLRVLRFMEAAEGNINNPIASFRHLCKFFDLVTLYWFGLRRQWSQPIYLAVHIFKEEDPDFYKHLMSVSQEKSFKKKIQLLRNVYKSLFKDDVP